MPVGATGRLGGWGGTLILLGLSGMPLALQAAAQAQEGRKGQQDNRGDSARTRDTETRPTPSRSEVVSTTTSVGSSGTSSPSASAPRTEAQREEAVRAHLAPQLDAIRATIREGRPERALGQARDLATRVEALAGKKSLAAADALELVVQAQQRLRRGGDDESRDLLRRIVDIRERAGAPELERPQPAPRPVISTAVSGGAASPRGTPENFRMTIRSALETTPCDLLLRQDVKGSSELYLRCLEMEAEQARLGGDLPRAADLYAQAQTLCLQAGRDDLELAHILFALARVRTALLDYRAARPLFQHALEIRERSLGNRPLLATTLNDLGNAEFLAGHYSAARSLYERALAIWERGADGTNVIVVLDNLGRVLWALGDYARARPIYERALARSERDLGRRSPLLISNLNNYASLLYSTGDFSGARTYYERALGLAEKALGRESVTAGQIGNNLGTLSAATGDYERARHHFEYALRLSEKHLGPEHPHVATVLTNLAMLAESRGDAGARPLYERALATREKVLGPEHPSLASLLTNLARMYEAEGRMGDARALIERALAVREKALGPEHPDVAESLVALADDRWISGEREEAQRLCERAAAIQERALGEQHPALAATLLRLGRLLAEGNENRRALEAALRAERISADHLAWTARSLAEGEALLYAATRVSALNLALSFAESSGEGAVRTAVFDAVVRSRALVLDEMATRRRLGLGQSGPKASPAARALTSASQRLANLIVRGPGPDSAASYRLLVTEAREARNAAERTLAARIAPYRANPRQAGLAEVVAALPPGGALVSFVRYDRVSYADAGGERGAASPDQARWRQSRPSYLALVWSGREEGPALVPLGSAALVDSLVQRWREEAGRTSFHHAAASSGETGPDEAEAACRTAGLALRRQVWDPLATHLRHAARVFIVPDGLLHLLNFSALPDDGNGYLVDTGQLLHLLSAERDLLAVPKRPAPGRGLLAFGGPDFDDARLFASRASSRDKTRKAGHRASTQMAALGEVTSVARGASDCGGLGDLRFGPLPGAGRESAEVAEIWSHEGNDAPAEGTVHLTASEASEAAFKAKAPGRRILHLATHGFFLAGPCTTAGGANVRGVGGLVSGATTPPDDEGSSLQLSGLALAGANHRVLAGPREEDGILTAEEIAALDLTGVEWAVLSACNTGIGNVRAGEGVFGLRRAFEIAGAGTLIMSLWPVEDEATGQWMRALYSARLKQGTATDEAVRSASLELLRKRREAGLSTHPHYWASFVAAGDWR